MKNTTSIDAEIARWHRVSDGAVGDRHSIMELFLATVNPELRDRLHDAIKTELENDGRIVVANAT